MDFFIADWLNQKYVFRLIEQWTGISIFMAAILCTIMEDY